MGRRKLRNCSRCGVRHVPPIGVRCEREEDEFQKKNGEMGGASGDGGDGPDVSRAGSDDIEWQKEEMPTLPTYRPLGEDPHVPLFQSKPGDARKFDFVGGITAENKTYQAQSGWPESEDVKETPAFTLPAQNRSAGAQPQGYERWRSNPDRGNIQEKSAGSFMLPPRASYAYYQPAATSEFPDNEMERRLRRIEGMVERLSDVQRAQVKADYFRMHERKEEQAAAASAANVEAEKDSSSSDSESEVGEWTERDGIDLWRSTKEKKKRNPFEHGSYIRKGESVDSYEKLMVVTFRTMEQLQELNRDVKGLVKHGLAMSEKAATGVYKVDAFVRYDESVRERAGRQGPGTFGQVNHEDCLRFFCYDSVDKQKAKPSAGATSTKKRGDRTCLRYNGDTGCSFKNCSFAHRCIACEEVGHARKDCKVLKKKEAK